MLSLCRLAEGLMDWCSLEDESELPGSGRSEVEMKFKVDSKPQLLPSSCTSQPQKNHILMISSTFQSQTWTSKVFFSSLLQLRSTLVQAGGMTCGGGRRFSPDFRVQTLIWRAGAAPPHGCRRCLLGRDASRILRGSFTESRGSKWLPGMFFTHRLSRVVEIFKVN